MNKYSLHKEYSDILKSKPIFKNRFICILWLCVLVSCNDKQKSMQEIIKKTEKEQFNIPENYYASSIRIAYFDSISKAAPENQKDRFILQKAHALLYAGKTQEALVVLKNLQEKSNNGLLRYKLNSQEEELIGPLLALAYMRLGEQQNCIHHHKASASCIIPINPEGYHQVQEGSGKLFICIENY